METQEEMNIHLNRVTESCETVPGDSTRPPVAEARRRTVLRRALSSVVAIIGISVFLGAAPSAFSEEGTSVEVGKIKSRGLRKQVESYDVDVANVSIASAWLDEDSNRFFIRGLREGTTTVTFVGRYRRIIVGGVLREDTRPFRHEIQVVVTTPEPDTRPDIKNYSVSRGASRTTRLEVFLGAGFGKANKQNVEWRSVRAQTTNPRVASTVVSSNRAGWLTIEIVGNGPGRATVWLAGERRLFNTWQKVTRSIEVVVR